MKMINLEWGESVVVRQAFLEVAHSPVEFSREDLLALKYPEHEGDPKLIDLTRKIIKRQTGQTYRFILLTNGATGGVTIALRAYAEKGYYNCYTNPGPYFSLYPGMIEAAGMTHVKLTEYGLIYPHPVFLVDSPSNPRGLFSLITKVKVEHMPVIWDGVYHSNVYCPKNSPIPEHDVYVGSYSKLTGMNGLRTGWIATNDPLLYERMVELATAEYCGLSGASTKVILDTTGSFTVKDWEAFEGRAKLKLDCNREEWSKLEKFFSGSFIPNTGMFHYTMIDYQCQKLLEKSGIIWTKGSTLGTSDDYGRFSLGQDCELTRQAVKTILKNDRR